MGFCFFRVGGFFTFLISGFFFFSVNGNEMAQIDALQTATASEHTSIVAVSLVASVEIFQSLDALQLREVVEPESHAANRICFCHTFVEHDVFTLGWNGAAVSNPQVQRPLVYIISVIITNAKQLLDVIRQIFIQVICSYKLSPIFIRIPCVRYDMVLIGVTDSIFLITTSEVEGFVVLAPESCHTLFVLTSLEVANVAFFPWVGIVDVDFVFRVTLFAEISAAQEHIFTVRQIFTTFPVVVTLDMLQTAATLEHGSHELHLVGVEIVQAKYYQT